MADLGRSLTSLPSSCCCVLVACLLALLQPMCQSQLQMVNGKLIVSKQCGSYTDCLRREQDNYRLCNVSHSSPVTSMQCTFCCVGTGCNQGDLGGRFGLVMPSVCLLLVREKQVVRAIAQLATEWWSATSKNFF